MQAELNALRDSALASISHAPTLLELEELRVLHTGRSGHLAKLGENLRTLPKDERPAFGKLLNDLRQTLQDALDSRKAELQQSADADAFAHFDPTLPGLAPASGTLHPLTQLAHRAISIFRRLGFALADGPHIETPFRCFDALNTPPDHPARLEKDTFYLADGRLLRTHTSTVQISTMETSPPPLRIIAPGSAFRRDEVDATHTMQFTQMEGLCVDTDISVADLKGTLEYFFREFLGNRTEVRFRPHFFPFTEPSFEIDVLLRLPNGNEKWIEVAGCGLVDPAVFQAVNQSRGDNAYDPEVISGYAFGFGLDRLAMTLYGIPDIRSFSENDLRFLAQF